MAGNSWVGLVSSLVTGITLMFSHEPCGYESPKERGCLNISARFWKSFARDRRVFGSILENRPYTDGPGGSGQYTHKVYHVGMHIPGWFRSILPKAALRVVEESWNAYPYTRTRCVCLPLAPQHAICWRNSPGRFNSCSPESIKLCLTYVP